MFSAKGPPENGDFIKSFVKLNLLFKPVNTTPYVAGSGCM